MKREIKTVNLLYRIRNRLGVSIQKNMDDNLEELKLAKQVSSQGLLAGDSINSEEDVFNLTEITITKSVPEPIEIDGEKEILKFLQSGVLKGYLLINGYL